MNFPLTFLALFKVASSATVSVPSQKDYQLLQSSLKEFIATNGEDPSRNIPLLVRLSFHDLSLIDGSNGMGPKGCLIEKSIQEIKDNAGLAPIVSQLATFVGQKFPSTPYSFGDVVSLAGKVAVETAYPCMQIKWSYGRSKCHITTPGEIPGGNITTLAQLQPFLNRYGLDANEMAVLIAGAHGIKNAKANNENSGFGTQVFSGFSSGMNWIDVTFKLPWLKPRNSDAFFANDPFPLSVPIMRIPIDLAFFPSVAKKNDGFPDDHFDETEQFLKSFTTQPRSVFDQEFEKVYSKMLNIGVDPSQMVAFAEPPNLHVPCPEFVPGHFGG